MKKVMALLLCILIISGSAIPVLATEKTGNINLTVVADQTVKLIDGQKSYPINVTIRNNSPTNASNVTAQAIIDNPQGVYIDGDGFILSSSKNISMDNEERGTFNISAEDNFETKTVPIKIKLDFYDGEGNHQSQVETIYVRVIGSAKAVDPIIEIKKIASTGPNGKDTFTSGSTFSVGFQVSNPGDAVARNIKVSLGGLKEDGITLAQGLSTKDITSLAKGETSTIFYDLKSAKGAKSGTYLLSLKYTFVGDEKTTTPKEGTYEFAVEINKSDAVPAYVEFENIKFPTGVIARNSPVNISFNLVNKGRHQAENLVIKAVSQDLTGLASKSVSSIKVKDLKPGESRNFSFDFISTPAAETKNYPVEISVEYTDANTVDEPHKNSQVVGVFVKAPKEGTGTGKLENTSTPKLIIEDYHFDSDIIQAGQTFTMYLTLFNTNAKKNVKNIKLFLTSEPSQSVAEASGNSGTQTPAPTTETSGGGGSSVFTPVGSSNTFYIADIAPGAKVNKEVTLSTVPDTAPRTYTLTANFEYEDSKGNKYTSTEIIGIPVVQKSALGVGEIVLQSQYFANSEGPLTVDFYNTGKSALYNVMVKIEGDFRVDVPTYYKGNLTPGASDTFSVNITPESPGQKKGKLIFSFEDSKGDIKEVVKEFEFSAEEEMPSMDTAGMETDSKGFNPLLIAVPLLLLLAGGGIYIFLKKRKSKKEDEDLMI